MNSLQQFVKTLSPTVLNGRHFDGIVGDVVLFRTAMVNGLIKALLLLVLTKA